jgi:hypothetical protein
VCDLSYTCLSFNIERLELHDAIEVALDKIKCPFLKLLCFRRIWRLVHADVKKLFSIAELTDEEVDFLIEVREILRMLEGRVLTTKYTDVTRFEDSVIVGESKDYEHARMNATMIFETHSYIMCCILDKHCGLHDRDALSGLFPSEIISCSLDFSGDLTVTQKEMERRKLFVVHLVQHSDAVPRSELEELSKRLLKKKGTGNDFFSLVPIHSFPPFFSPRGFLCNGSLICLSFVFRCSEDRVNVDLMRVCLSLRKGDDELADHIITRAADPPRVGMYARYE